MTRAWLLFVSVSSLLAALLASLNSIAFDRGLTPAIAGLSLGFGLLTSGLFSRSLVRRGILRIWHQANRSEQVFFLVLFAGGVLSLLNLVSMSGGILGTANPNNLGDLPLHLHLVEFFVRGAEFPPQNPTFAGLRLQYAYGMDFWDALWVSLGLPVGASFFLTGLIAFCLTGLMLWRLGGVVLVAAFFFSGGVALTFDALSSFGPSSNLAWKNLFLSVFFTQRGFLFALPAGLYLIRKWWRVCELERSSPGFSFYWIWAVLPFFHLHTFAILSLWFLLTFVFHRRAWFGFLLAAPLAALFVLRSLGTGTVSNAVGFDFFWSLKSLDAWVLNFSSWLIVPLALTYCWVRRRAWMHLVSMWTLTAFVLSVRLAPWSWDQIKVILWVYLLWTAWFIHETSWRRKGAWALVFALFWPGLLQWSSGLPSLTGRYEVQTLAEREQVKFLIQDLHPDEIVAASVDHRHPLLGLGQSLVLGFPPHAWSHGLPSEERKKKLDEILSGRPGGERFAQELGVKWIVWKDNLTLQQSSAAFEAWTKWGWIETRRSGPWHLWRVK